MTGRWLYGLRMHTCPHDSGTLSPLTRTPRPRLATTGSPSEPAPVQVAWLCEHGHVLDWLSEAPIQPAPSL